MSKAYGLLKRSSARGRRRAFALLPLSFVSALILFALLPKAESAPALREELWVTNGPVYEAETVDDTLYVGGDFSQVGPHTGPFGVVSTQTGAPAAGLPKVSGVVKSVAADGAGGWYVGGKFTSVAPPSASTSRTSTRTGRSTRAGTQTRATASSTR